MEDPRRRAAKSGTVFAETCPELVTQQAEDAAPLPSPTLSKTRVEKAEQGEEYIKARRAGTRMQGQVLKSRIKARYKTPGKDKPRSQAFRARN